MKYTKKISIILLTLAIVCAVILAKDLIIHNINRYKFGLQLMDLPIPFEATKSSPVTTVTKLSNSQQCVFISEVEIITDLTREELQHFYKEQSLLGELQIEQPPILKRQGYESARYWIKSIPNDELLSQNLNAYKFSITSVGTQAGLDVRCW